MNLRCRLFSNDGAMKQTFTLEMTINCDEPQLRKLHGDEWMKAFQGECQEFVKDLREFLDQHPFVEACVSVDGKQVNAAALLARRIHEPTQ